MATNPYDPRLNEQQGSGTNVLGGPQAPTQNPAPQAGAAPTQAAPTSQPRQSTQNKAKSGKSGMFTNLKSYIDKNKPQATVMAGAATKDFGKQAGSIADQAAKRNQDFQNKVTARQSDVAAQKQFGQDIITGASQFTVEPGQKANFENIGQAYQAPQPAAAPVDPNAPAIQTQVDPNVPVVEPVAQPTQPSAEDNFARFQDIATGGTVSNLTNVGDLDISEQGMRARALQDLAGKAGSEEGRRGLLRETYAKNRQYTRGQEGLDDMILGGSQDAREQLVEGTKGTSEQLQGSLQDARRAALESKGQLSRDARAVGGDLQEMAALEAQKQVTGAQSSLDEFNRSFGAEQAQFEQALQGKGELTQEMLDKYMSPEQQAAFKQKATQDLGLVLNQTGGKYGYRRGRELFFDSNKDSMNQWVREATGDMQSANRAKSDAMFKSDAYLRGTPEQRKSIEDQAYSLRNQHTANKQLFDQMSADINQTGMADFLKRQIASGKDLSGLMSNRASGMTAQDMASEDQLARYEALSRLAGTNASDRELDFRAKRRAAPTTQGGLNLDSLRKKLIFG